MRKVALVEGEYYHIFNRGVDKRKVFLSEVDFRRFKVSMQEFNTELPIGSIYEHSYNKEMRKGDKSLVELIAYCLNPNHFHFILRQIAENGISKFMQRLGNGYTKYFNDKNKRSGSLFQGKFKSVHISNNEQLIYLSAYVNLNYLVHALTSKQSKSSWEEYITSKKGICSAGIITGQFPSIGKYQKMAEGTVREIRKRREEEKNLLEFEPILKLGHPMSKLIGRK